VIIESLACGTPVLATPRGAVAEIVEHGRTGFHCETQEDFLAAVKRVGRIDRAECRRDFERRFSAAVMAAAYEDVYERMAIDPIRVEPHSAPTPAVREMDR
jgi:glycosyltransferase involved in cell wall biosynthesis